MIQEKTRQQLISAVDLKSSTVYMRMKNKCLSFEEALIHDNRTALEKAADKEGVTEFEYVTQLLPRFGNKKAPLAKWLGISRTYLYSVLERDKP